MKISNIFTVLLLASLFMFAPLIRGPAEITLETPLTEKSIIVKIYGTDITLSSNIVTQVNYSIVWLLPDNTTQELANLADSVFETEPREVDLPGRGFYLFTFWAGRTVTVNISERSIPIEVGLYTAVLLVIILLNRLRVLIAPSIDY